MCGRINFLRHGLIHPDNSHSCSIKLAHLHWPVQSALSCVQEHVHVLAKYSLSHLSPQLCTMSIGRCIKKTPNEWPKSISRSGKFDMWKLLRLPVLAPPVWYTARSSASPCCFSLPALTSKITRWKKSPHSTPWHSSRTLNTIYFKILFTHLLQSVRMNLISCSMWGSCGMFFWAGVVVSVSAANVQLQLIQSWQALYNPEKYIEDFGGTVLIESAVPSSLPFFILIQATSDNWPTNVRMDPTVPSERGIPLAVCGKRSKA